MTNHHLTGRLFLKLTVTAESLIVLCVLWLALSSDLLG
jgi:hypothetical protein